MVNKKNNYGIIKKGAMRAEQRKIFKEYEGVTVRLGYLDQSGEYQGKIGTVDIVKGSKYVHFTIDGDYYPTWTIVKQKDSKKREKGKKS